MLKNIYYLVGILYLKLYRKWLLLRARRREHPLVEAFIAHNRKVFPRRFGRRWRTPEVLIEFNYVPIPNLIPWHISYSYMANVLAEDSRARIVAYAPRSLDPRTPAFTQSHPSRLGFRRAGIFRSLPQYRIYESFGVSKFFDVQPNERQKQKARAIYETVKTSLNAKADVEAIDIDGVRIGDLIYDTYLRVYEKATIDLKSAEFQDLIYEAICQFVYWREYFDRHDVRAVNVSHCAYTLAIPMRLAVSRGIPAFEPRIDHVARLSKENLFSYNDFLYHREWFAALPAEDRIHARAEARKRLAQRFSGEVAVDMVYSTRSAFQGNSAQRLIAPSEKTKVLVATHCFLDNPHAYGDNLFPDFYEWIDFLGTISRVTDYDWYLKMHPDYLPGSKRILDELVAKHKKFHLLPSDASHHQLIAEGIDVALTVYGTIGVEYAALGIPVVNASQVNPHIRYGFNLHPKTVDDYMEILFSLDSLSIDIDQDEVLECYYMKGIYGKCSLFFQDYPAVVAGLGGFRNHFRPELYGLWLDECTPERHDSIMKSVRTFVRSGDYLMSARHLA